MLRQQWFTSAVLPALPRRSRWFLRRLYFLPSDAIDRVWGRREPMVPARGANFSGSVDDFKISGRALVHRLVDVAGLTPDSVVLDVGAGWGRLAVALTTYLSGSGRYEGMDIVRSAIQWCNDNISRSHPRFRFTVADIYNKEYNPNGRLAASEYRFPYADGTFDLVVLASVFTHLLPVDTEHYIVEVSRVLKTGGRCYASYSLLDDESVEAMEAGRSTLRFRPDAGVCWVVDPKVPELAVGYREAYVLDLYDRHGLAGPCTIYHGSWSGRPSLSGRQPPYSQDIVVGTKI